MARVLKSTGIATRAKMVIAVDDDGTTIKEFVNGWTHGAGLIVDGAVDVGTASYRGSGTKPYFETKDNSGTPQAIALETNIDLTTRTANIGLCLIAICAGSGGNASSQPSIFIPLNPSGATTAQAEEQLSYVTNSSPAKAGMYIAGGTRAQTTTTIPTDGTTKFTLAGQYLNDGSQHGINAGGQLFYAPESSSGSSITAFEPASPANSNWQPSGVLAITGVAGLFQPDNHSTTPNVPISRSCPGKWLMFIVLDSLATLAELQALHDDPFGEIFEPPPPPTGPTIDTHPANASRTEGQTATFTVAATTSGGALSYQWQVDDGEGWENVSTGTGGTTDEYETATLTLADDGLEFRCVVTDDNGPTESNAATLTVTEADAIVGELAATESGDDTFSASGELVSTGSLSATESGADTFAAEGAGEIGGGGEFPTIGLLDADESGADTAAGTGAVLVQGELDATEEGADTFHAEQGEPDEITGSLSATEEGSDTFFAIGGSVIVGTLNAVESGADGFAAEGAVLVAGAFDVIESGHDTFSSSGEILIQGDLIATEVGADTFLATSPGTTVGALLATESGVDTFFAIGANIIGGTVSATESGSDQFRARGNGRALFAAIRDSDVRAQRTQRGSAQTTRRSRL